MRLYIAFADNIEAQLIAHLVKFGCARIVGSADAVNIILLHEDEVSQDMLARNGITERGICIMAIDTFHFYGGAVYLENAAAP